MPWRKIDEDRVAVSASDSDSARNLSCNPGYASFTTGRHGRESDTSNVQEVHRKRWPRQASTSVEGVAGCTGSPPESVGLSERDDVYRSNLEAAGSARRCIGKDLSRTPPSLAGREGWVYPQGGQRAVIAGLAPRTLEALRTADMNRGRPSKRNVLCAPPPLWAGW